MAEEQENSSVRLTAPVALDDKTFKALMKDDLKTNNPAYLSEVAARYKLDLEKNNDEVLEKACEEQIDIITEQCIADALDENTISSYALLQKACYFSENDMSYMSVVEGENLSSSIAKYIEERLENVEVLKPFIDFTSSINEAILYSTGDYPNFSSYKANQLKEKFENTDIALSDEEKAKLFYIASKLYRQLDAKNNIHNPYADNYAGGQEKECLNKVLALSTDYKLISYCQNRLPEKDNEKGVVRAYKKALTKKQTRGDAYKINKELANIYFARSKQVGYLTANSEKAIASQKTINYLMGAYRFAEKEDKVPLLKKMAEVQLILGKKQEWKNIKEVIATKFLKGQARCMALISIAEKTGDLAFYQKAVNEAEKAKMKNGEKLEVLDKAYSGLSEHSSSAEEKKAAQDKLAEIRSKKANNMYSILGISSKEMD